MMKIIFYPKINKVLQLAGIKFMFLI
jgi:hypothetical protein